MEDLFSIKLSQLVLYTFPFLEPLLLFDTHLEILLISQEAKFCTI